MSQTLAFHHHGPPLEQAVSVPGGGAPKPLDYGLVYDPTRRAIVYVTSPGYHQVGTAWTFDGKAFAPVSTTTYRLGSQQSPWTSVYDAARGAVVAWSFDSDSGAYGVVIGKDAVLLEERAVADHERMDQTAKPSVVGGAGPGGECERAWDDLYGVFGYDVARGVTVCIGEDGVFELAGAQWKRVADAPALPKEVSGNRQHRGGAGAVWDARAQELVCWFIDGDDDVVRWGAWDGTTWKVLATDGLPAIWAGFGETGFAVGDHPEHGVVVYAGPEHGLFGRSSTGFVAIGGAGSGAPARGKGGQLAWDAARGVLVLGPFVNRAGTQHVFHEWANGAWKKIGASTTAAPFRNLSSGWQEFGRHRGVMHAVGLYLKTVAWDAASGWRWIVEDKAGDAQREDARVNAIATAWDGVLHAVMNDGGVMAFDGTAWARVAAPSEVWKEPFFPLVAFDPVRGVIVGWGASKKSGGRKNDTYVFDGKAWAKVKTAKTKPADLADKDAEFTLYWDPRAKCVARLGMTELAHFDGKDWKATPLGGAKTLERYRRTICCDPASGGVLAVNTRGSTIVRVEDGLAEVAGKFAGTFDRSWFDDTTLQLVVHDDTDAAKTFALDLRELF